MRSLYLPFVFIFIACGATDGPAEQTFIDQTELLQDDPCCCIYPNPDDFDLDDEAFTTAGTCRTLAGGCLTPESIDALQTPHICCEDASGTTCGE